jgi:hypothetical protein
MRVEVIAGIVTDVSVPGTVLLSPSVSSVGIAPVVSTGSVGTTVGHVGSEGQWNHRSGVRRPVRWERCRIILVLMLPELFPGCIFYIGITQILKGASEPFNLRPWA